MGRRPQFSRRPVIVTRMPGAGIAVGTIRIRSARPRPQCAEAATMNIRQSARRSSTSQAATHPLDSRFVQAKAAPPTRRCSPLEPAHLRAALCWRIYTAIPESRHPRHSRSGLLQWRHGPVQLDPIKISMPYLVNGQLSEDAGDHQGSSMIDHRRSEAAAHVEFIHQEASNLVNCTIGTITELGTWDRTPALR